MGGWGHWVGGEGVAAPIVLRLRAYGGGERVGVSWGSTGALAWLTPMVARVPPLVAPLALSSGRSGVLDDLIGRGLCRPDLPDR
jgi:hypothetical protein